MIYRSDKGTGAVMRKRARKRPKRIAVTEADLEKAKRHVLVWLMVKLLSKR